MGKILRQEIEFLQSLKKKQLFNTGSKEYIYTWGMAVENDGRIITNSEFQVTFSQTGCEYRAEIAPGLAERLRRFYMVPGASHGGAQCYSINSNLSAVLIWEQVLWTR
jgi:hypothetical protein